MRGRGRGSEKTQAEQEEGWLNVFMERLGDFVDGLDDLEEGLAEFGLGIG